METGTSTQKADLRHRFSHSSPFQQDRKQYKYFLLLGRRFELHLGEACVKELTKGQAVGSSGGAGPRERKS